MAEELEIRITADTDDAERKFGRLGGILKGGLKVGFASAAIGVGLLDTALGVSIVEAMEAEVNIAKLEQVIKSTGGVAGVTSDEAQDLADSLSKVTRFSDDTILSAETMLLTFTNVGEEVFPLATEAALDMSEMLGMDATNAAMMLGKALNDPIEGVSALRRVGVALTDQQEEQIRKFMEVGDVASAQKVILDELGTEMGGVAQAAGDTLAGKITILKNELLNQAEAIGMQLIPHLESLADWLAVKVPEGVATLKTAFEEGGLKGVGETILGAMEEGLSDIGQWAFDKIVLPLGQGILEKASDPLFWVALNLAVENVLRGLAEGFLDLGQWVFEKVILPLGAAVLEKTADPLFWVTLQLGATKILEGLAEGFIDLVTWVWDKIIFPLGEGLFELVSSTEFWATLYTVGSAVLDGLAVVFLTIGQWAKEHILDPIVTWITSEAVPGLLTAAGEMGQAILDGLIDALGGLATAIAQMINDAIPDEIVIDAGILGTTRIPIGNPIPMAAGGNVMAGYPYLVGEQGRELFWPREAGTIIPNGQLGGDTFILNLYSNGSQERVVDDFRMMQAWAGR